jgi:hypothetical protein
MTNAPFTPSCAPTSSGITSIRMLGPWAPGGNPATGWEPPVTSSQTAGATIWPDALPNSIREPSGPGADPDSVTVSLSAR